MNNLTVVFTLTFMIALTIMINLSALIALTVVFNLTVVFIQTPTPRARVMTQSPWIRPPFAWKPFYTGDLS